MHLHSSLNSINGIQQFKIAIKSQDPSNHWYVEIIINPPKKLTLSKHCRFKAQGFTYVTHEFCLHWKNKHSHLLPVCKPKFFSPAAIHIISIKFILSGYALNSHDLTE